jgi:hypothetical protein
MPDRGGRARLMDGHARLEKVFDQRVEDVSSRVGERQAAT